MTYAATEDREARIVQGQWEEGRLVTTATGEPVVEEEAPTEEPAAPAESQ
jgi:hypothetical protein